MLPSSSNRRFDPPHTNALNRTSLEFENLLSELIKGKQEPTKLNWGDREQELARREAQLHAAYHQLENDLRQFRLRVQEFEHLMASRQRDFEAREAILLKQQQILFR